MAITEPTINTKLADVLRKLNPRWRDPNSEMLRSQQTQRIAGEPSLQIDLELEVKKAAPVVMEAEIEPAANVEADAMRRLGKPIVNSMLPIETVVAIRYPSRLKEVAETKLEAELEAADDLRWAVLTEATPARRPSEGWIQGNVQELASTLEMIAMSPRVLKEAADTLERGITQIAHFIESLDAPATHDQIANSLYQDQNTQTWRMAASVLANAFVFQDTISATTNVPSLAALRLIGGGGRITQPKTLDVWQQVLKINYLPVFQIANKILESFGAGDGNKVSEASAKLAFELIDAGVSEIQNMTGQMFGQLITDRKFLATFYTLPSSARLLAQLAVERLDVDWKNRKAVEALRIADFACGTGALLSAAQESVSAKARRAGLDDATLHAKIIEKVLIGADIMPAAAHLTTTMLSTAHPQVAFNQSGIHVVAYGKKHAGDEIAIGSLDLLRDGGAVGLWSTAEQISGKSDSIEEVDPFVLADDSCDLVIMNPPFTRPTNHEGASKQRDLGKQVAPVPSFAGFGNTVEEQGQMSAVLKVIVSKIRSHSGASGGVCVSNGHAGLASNFVDLANAKLKAGGVLALVLPFVAVSGPSWRNFRVLLDRHYQDVQFISVATAGSNDRAFSNDTNMAEVLVLATKRVGGEIGGDRQQPAARCVWVSLKRRPTDLIDAYLMANSLNGQKSRLAVTSLKAGDDILGYQVAAEVAEFEFAGILEPELALTANAFGENCLRFPRYGNVNLGMTKLGQLGKSGPVHRSISGVNRKTGAATGPFILEDNRSAEDFYPILWAHNVASGRESAMEVAHDRAGRPHHSMTKDANRVFETATRLHINGDFRMNSQPLGACLTPERVIGGVAWPSFILETPDWEAAICVWLNSTLGLMGRWSVSNRQQLGRARLSVSTLVNIPVIDPREISDEQLRLLNGIFSDFRNRPLLPAHEAYKDDARIELDKLLIEEVLGLPESATASLGLLREHWCAEPSVHGGKWQQLGS